MLLKENPFYLLEVDSQANKEQIMDAADDKSFDDADHEKEYNDARDVLLNPRKRVNAEMSWFLGMSWSDIPKTETALRQKNYPNTLARITGLMNSFSGLSIEEAVRTILQLDDLYAKLQIPFVRELINQERKKAGLTLIREDEFVQSGLKSLAEDIHQAISGFTKSLKRPVYSRLANEVAEKLIADKKMMGNVLNRFFDTYELDVTCYVLEEGEAIKKILQTRDVHAASLVPRLEPHVRKAASMTRAGCLLTDAKGSQSFGEAGKIFSSIYDKTFDFYNDAGEANNSYRLLVLLKECFPLVAKRYPKFEENLRFLQEKSDRVESAPKQTPQPTVRAQANQPTQIYQQAKAAFDDILRQINTRGRFADGYQAANKEFLAGDVERSYVHIVEGFLAGSYNPQETKKVHEYAAIIYFQIAQLYTWVEGWDKSRHYVTLANQQIRYTNNTEWKKRIAELQTKLTPVNSKQPASTQQDSDSGCLLLALLALGPVIGGSVGGVVGFAIGCVLSYYILKKWD